MLSHISQEVEGKVFQAQYSFHWSLFNVLALLIFFIMA
jgi:hypothetical protein